MGQPTQCCQIRKVEPLMRHLEPFDWWFTGLRREQSPTRAGLRKVEDHKTPTGKMMKKVSVLADWTMAQVDVHGDPRARRGCSQRAVGRQEAGVRYSYLFREGIDFLQLWWTEGESSGSG